MRGTRFGFQNVPEFTSEIPKLNLDRKDSQTATSLLLEAGGVLAGTTSGSRNATNLLGAGTEGNEVTADSQIATGRLLGATGTQESRRPAPPGLMRTRTARAQTAGSA